VRLERPVWLPVPRDPGERRVGREVQEEHEEPAKREPATAELVTPPPVAVVDVVVPLEIGLHRSRVLAD
jgi:hypothetical protein